MTQENDLVNFCRTCYVKWSDPEGGSKWHVCDCCHKGLAWNACSKANCIQVLQWHEELARLVIESNSAERVVQRAMQSAPKGQISKRKRLEHIE